MIRRRCVNHQLRAIEGFRLVVGGHQGLAEFNTGEEAWIFVALVDGLGNVNLICPEAHIVTGSAQQVGERSSPRAGTDHSAAHHVPKRAATSTARTTTRLIASAAAIRRDGALPGLPKRFSSPRRNRAIFA